MNLTSHLALPALGRPHPLRPFSLLDSMDELKKLAQVQTPLLGNVSLKGQTTVWYAKPNTGKTLICMSELPFAVADQRIRGEDVYYVAADDTPTGVIEKIEILKPYGIHVLAPGFKGFDAKHLTKFLEDMINNGNAQDSFVILDTLKKSVSLMDKRESSGFADVARRLVMKGGSFLGLAHTNKRSDKSGKPIYAGTSDILDDFDCGYTITEVSDRTSVSERVVQFDCIKSRGNVAQEVAYAYNTDPALSYAERVESVRVLGAGDLSTVRDEAQLEKDADLIAVIEDCIADSPKAKMELTKEIALQTRVGRHTIGALIDRYTGDDPGVHRWNFDVRDRGKRVYFLNRSTDESPDPGNTF